jgi:hypothetical protein
MVAEAVLAHLASRSGLRPRSLVLAHLPRLVHKPWSTLYFLTVSEGGERHQVVAKIVHFPDQATPEVSWQSEELLIRGQSEFDTLTSVYHHFARQPDRSLAALYPLAYLPEINAIVTDFVDGRPLYDACLAMRHLLSPGGRQRARHMMQQAGEWLQWFHRMPLQDAPAERSFGPPHIFQALLQEVEQLRTLGVDLGSWPLWERTLAVLSQVTDSERVWTHGDFHLRNVLVLSQGGVLGFDTALERVDSPYFDLGKFLADLKTRRATLLRLGLLPPPGLIQSLTQAFLSGYLSESPKPCAALALYEGFFIVQKWVESLTLVRDTLTRHADLLGTGVRGGIINPAFCRIVGRWIKSVNVAVS